MSEDQDQYPWYISTNPTGEDLLEGKSQEKISAAIAKHIQYIDSLSEEDSRGLSMPRVIGVEGSWGSGKSNILHILEHEKFSDDFKYKFFTYDAWANQEDLQRRTILERLTSYLVDKNILKGKVKIRLMKSDGNNELKLHEKEVTWKKKLDLLMAKRVENITSSVTPLNDEFKYFMLVLAVTPILVTLMNALKSTHFNGYCFIGITILLAILPTLLFLGIIRYKNLELKNVLHFYQPTTENRTTYQVFVESEPSIREFSSWMKDISDGLDASKEPNASKEPDKYKLIVIFDNMDRLPADKVKKLWSAIHSIFALENFKNIWCIIPYDFQHLSCAFGSEEGERERLTKCFIDKSFPVVYRVPEPVVTDYKKIFDDFFEKAFDKKVDENDKETISRCYRIIHLEPNIRTIISFINRMVTLSKTYRKLEEKESIGYVGMALYLLREDNLLKHPRIKKDGEEVACTTNEYLLSDDFFFKFEGIVLERDNIRNDVAALVYGIDKDKAYQLLMYKTIEMCFKGEGSTTLIPYTENSWFAQMLPEVVHRIDAVYYGNVAKELDKIEESKVSEKARESILLSWNFLANRYLCDKRNVDKYTPYERNILKHVKGEIQESVAKVFCSGLTSRKNIKGDRLFETLSELFNEPFAKTWDISKICPKIDVYAEEFASYVKSASDLFGRFPVYTDPKELVNFLASKMIGDEDCLEVIKILHNDDNHHYNLSSLADIAHENLKKEELHSGQFVRMLHVVRLFRPNLGLIFPKKYLLSLWQEVKQNEKDFNHPSDICKELYVLLAVSCPGTLQDELELRPDDRDCKEYAERVLFYTTTSDLIRLTTLNPRDSALQGLLLISLVNKVTDNNSSMEKDFVLKWDSLISSNQGIRVDTLLDFSEAWGYNALVGEDANSSIIDLLPNPEWMGVVLSSKTHIAKELIQKAVTEIKSKPSEEFFNMRDLSLNNTTWSKLLEKLVNGGALSNPLGEFLNGIIVKALHLCARNMCPHNSVITNLLSLGYENYSEFSSEVNDIRRRIFRQEDDYVITVDNFPILHRWIERTDIKEYVNDFADTILAPIVVDASCQDIILSMKDYYSPAIRNSKDTSSALHNQLKQLVKSQNRSEFIEYIDSIVSYESEE